MDSLDKIKNLLDSCLLPQLQHDLDSIPIEREHFTTYHECLELQLPLLYDWIQQQPNIFVWNDEEKGAKLEIKTKLIVLLCEITSSNTIYQLNRKDLISNAERVLQNTAKLTNELDESLFKYYEDKLHKDKWKRQLGAVNGFVKYLEYRFNNALDHDSKMSQKFLMFCLSVALNVRTCYETHYKTLSTIIFLIMLQQGVNIFVYFFFIPYTTIVMFVTYKNIGPIPTLKYTDRFRIFISFFESIKTCPSVRLAGWLSM
ncbi:hypothetical protein CVS40_12515 [Lucilia cuprina]|nr:hypothetical protein CVS40_12515 [Lucilia cuprina]